MNIVKFNDMWLELPDPTSKETGWKDQSYIGDVIKWETLTEEDSETHEQIVVGGRFIWKTLDEIPEDNIKRDLVKCGMLPEDLVKYFNDNFRNKYTYVVNWQYLIPLTTPTGTPWDYTDGTYIDYSLNPDQYPDGLSFNTLPKIPFKCFDTSWKSPSTETEKYWYDKTTTTKTIRNEQIKYEYLNEFTPDDNITIDELKRFRKWLASILLENEPLIQEWPTEDLLRIMLTYYKQDMKDSTIEMLAFMAPYMEQRELVIGSNNQTRMGFLGISLGAGCGCSNNGLANYTGIAANAACDPIGMYRTAIYNYMVDTFSNLNYWTQQVEICIEMKKYIDGILKAGFPLSSNIVDTITDCSCSSVDTDAEATYRKMLENLSTSLQYIIDDEISGNKNFILTSFNNWAVYLYEHMYWV